MSYPKIFYDNIIYNLQNAGGVSAYWYQLCKRILNYNVVYFGGNNNNLFSKNLNINFQKESVLPISLLRYLPFTKYLCKNSVFHSSYYRFSFQKYVSNITTVHDFTYEYFYSGLNKQIHTCQKNFAILNSAGIICVSQNTKKDLIKFLPSVNHSRIKVIYNGVGDEFFPVNNFDSYSGFDELIGLKFVLFVGDRSPYKNFTKAVEVVKEIKNLHLVIVGGKTLSDSELVNLSVLKGRFHSYIGVDVKRLNLLYNRAFCLLYPSSYEGFGIPVVEAMKAGCPVVSTNLSSIPEVAGDAALLVDNPDTDSLLEKVNLLFNPVIRENLRIKGFKQASKFSWDRCFEETMTFYHEVWSRERNG